MKYCNIFLLAICVGCASNDPKELQPDNLREMPQCPTAETIDHFVWVLDHFNLGCGVCAKDVYSAVYKGQTVIYIPCGGPACDCVSTKFLYDCQGSLVKALTDSPADQTDAKWNLGPF